MQFRAVKRMKGMSLIYQDAGATPEATGCHMSGKAIQLVAIGFIGLATIFVYELNLNSVCFRLAATSWFLH